VFIFVEKHIRKRGNDKSVRIFAVELFKGNLDPNYFRDYSKRDAFSLVRGTMSLKEDKSFLATTIMNLRKDVTITSYPNARADVNVADESGVFRPYDAMYEINEPKKFSTTSSQSQTQARQKPSERYITIRLSQDKSYSEYLSDKISAEFSRYVDGVYTMAASDALALQDFISQNILPIFILNGVELYVKKYNGASEPVINNEESGINLLRNGFSVDKNFKTKILNNKDIIITYAMEKEFLYSFNIKLKLVLL
jgi:hypothetical protein